MFVAWSRCYRTQWGGHSLKSFFSASEIGVDLPPHVSSCPTRSRVFPKIDGVFSRSHSRTRVRWVCASLPLALDLLYRGLPPPPPCSPQLDDDTAPLVASHTATFLRNQDQHQDQEHLVREREENSCISSNL